MIHLILFTAQAMAEEAHHVAEGAHGAHGIPWTSIGVQAFNFGFLVVVLFFLLRKSVSAHFESRAREYKMLVERADQARKDAERSNIEIKERLAKLEVSAEQGLASAKGEAEDLKKRMIADAQALAQKLEQDAKKAVEVELEKAKAALRKDLLDRALEDARKSLKANLGSSEQKKLQNEFVEKIQVVGG